MPAGGPEEADSRLSALAELLKGLRVPGVPGLDGHPLQRLAPFLECQLPPESHERVRKAVAVLDAARQVRTAAQHTGARATVEDACAVLGLNYPVVDWTTGWQQVQIVVADACAALSDELRAAPNGE